MKKYLVFLLFFIFIICPGFSNEKNNTISNTSPATFNFINSNTAPVTLLSDGKETVKDYRSKFLSAAIGFTAADSVCLVAGLTGLIIYGVSLNVIFTSSSVSDGLFYSGIGMGALFMSLFAILLPGVIVFWILYGIQNKAATKTSSIKFSSNGLAFCVKF